MIWVRVDWVYPTKLDWRALPAGPQHCHPRARVSVPGCSEVSQPGRPSCLMGYR
jgi:hypothetical protein